MNFKGEAIRLAEADYKRAAERLDCDVAAVKAIADIESKGGGFLADGRPKILFEAHVFGRRTSYAFNRSHPNISSRKWNKKLYGRSGAAQYLRLNTALELSENAALSSASWGMFQVMGFNFETCGYTSLRAFIEAMVRSEGDHLNAMVGYVEHRRLDEALRNHDWATFAHGYNGSGYRENKYDEKLERAWEKYDSGLPTLNLQQIQAALNRAGAAPKLVEDGLAGKNTRRAIRAFQTANKLPKTGQAGPDTIKALLKV